MMNRKLVLLTRILTVLIAASWGDAAIAQRAPQTKITDVAGRVHVREKKVTPAERKAAAARLKAKVRAEKRAKRAKSPAADRAARAEAAAAAAPAGGYLVGPNDQLIPDYSGLVANWAYSPIVQKFVDPLPDLKGLIAKPDTVSYPGSDYYEIELFETSWQFHRDLAGGTLVRIYRQTSNGTDANGQNTVAPPPVGYLGPVIVATEGPAGPHQVHEQPAHRRRLATSSSRWTRRVMGSGPGAERRRRDPAGHPRRPALHAGPVDRTRPGGLLHAEPRHHPPPRRRDPVDQRRHDAPVDHARGRGHPVPGTASASTTSPTCRTPASPAARPIPRAPACRRSTTPTIRAARLMFYHDHAAGITRLNVYVGEAAGYLLRDDTEQALETAGLIPPLANNIPLVIQEKAFVDATTIGGDGSHLELGNRDARRRTRTRNGKTMQPARAEDGRPVVAARLPAGPEPVRPVGLQRDGPVELRPVVLPADTDIPYPPVPNPYYDYGRASPARPEQPPEIPGTPNPSWGAEAFLDTPVINGTAYPTLTVEAKAYRFRILNAGGDRFFNLQLYLAADKNSPTTAGTTGAVLCDGVNSVPLAGAPR